MMLKDEKKLRLSRQTAPIPRTPAPLRFRSPSSPPASSSSPEHMKKNPQDKHSNRGLLKMVGKPQDAGLSDGKGYRALSRP